MTETTKTEVRKPGEYLGKMILQCGRSSRVVTSYSWINDNGMIRRMVKDNFGDRDVFIVDRFHGDNFPDDWHKTQYTIDEVLSRLHPARITVDKPIPENAHKYPRYFKSVAHLSHVDVYEVHRIFGINDPSGAIQHASKKLLLSGVRTGGKALLDDVREARDTLNRFLEMHGGSVQQAQAN